MRRVSKLTAADNAYLAWLGDQLLTGLTGPMQACLERRQGFIRPVTATEGDFASLAAPQLVSLNSMLVRSASSWKVGYSVLADLLAVAARIRNDTVQHALCTSVIGMIGARPSSAERLSIAEQVTCLLGETSRTGQIARAIVRRDVRKGFQLPARPSRAEPPIVWHRAGDRTAPGC